MCDKRLASHLSVFFINEETLLATTAKGKLWLKMHSRRLETERSVLARHTYSNPRTDWELVTPPGIISYLDALVSLGKVRSDHVGAHCTADVARSGGTSQVIARMGFCLPHSPPNSRVCPPWTHRNPE